MTANIATQWSGTEVVGISFVSADIRSQWQANFMQIFPINYSSLPVEDETDKEVFEKNWMGDPKITFEQFKEESIS